ncbi:hypothetical protein R1flu_021529 [Riccia fluitans]|uniref:Uncharacterized protein n=1 Tax=Riccia fluitans TaxID=41844 RepID=A0ABD1ZPM8_9MARC
MIAVGVAASVTDRAFTTVVGIQWGPVNLVGVLNYVSRLGLASSRHGFTTAGNKYNTVQWLRELSTDRLRIPNGVSCPVLQLTDNGGKGAEVPIACTGSIETAMSWPKQSGPVQSRSRSSALSPAQKRERADACVPVDFGSWRGGQRRPGGAGIESRRRESGC